MRKKWSGSVLLRKKLSGSVLPRKNWSGSVLPRKNWSGSVLSSTAGLLNCLQYRIFKQVIYNEEKVFFKHKTYEEDVQWLNNKLIKMNDNIAKLNMVC